MLDRLEQTDGGEVPPWVSSVVSTASLLVGLVSTSLGGLVAATGGVDRLLRNAGPQVLLAIGLGIVGLFAIGLAFIRYRGTSTSHRAARTRLSVISLALFTAAFFFGAWALIASARTGSGPTISIARTEDRGGFSGSVTAGGRSSAEALQVEVAGVAGGDSVPSLLQRSVAGVGSDGNVDLPFEVAFEPGQFTQVVVAAWFGDERPDCQDSGAPLRPGMACSVVALTDASPSLSLTFDGSGFSRSLIGTASATAQDGVPVQVLITTRASRVLHEAVVVTGSQGVEIPIDITIGQRVRRVCALVVVLDGRPRAANACDASELDRSTGVLLYLTTTATPDQTAEPTPAPT